MSGPADPAPQHVIDAILFQYRRNVKTRKIAKDNGVKLGTVTYYIRKFIKREEARRSTFIGFSRGRHSSAESFEHVAPYKAPPHKRPRTGSASGFIRPLDYAKLTGRKA